MKMFGKVTMLLIVSILVMTPFSQFASAVCGPNPSGSCYEWRVGTKKDGGEVQKGSWIHEYTGNPSNRAGEKETFSFSVEYKHELTGTLKVAKKAVEGVVNYKFSTSYATTVSKTSAALKKGEYIKVYYKKNYKRTKVNQDRYKITGSNTRTKTGETKVVNADKATYPKIDIRYYKKSGARVASFGEEVPYKVETYDVTDEGELELDETLTDRSDIIEHIDNEDEDEFDELIDESEEDNEE